MRILIDVGHPAHVHYFRNFAKIMIERGNQVLFSARDRDIIIYLLDFYGFEYFVRGKGKNGLIGKILYLPKGIGAILKAARKFKPDIFLSFSTMYACQAAKIYGKPHIGFDDTEHAKFQQMLSNPFTSVVLTPECFYKDFGRKHLRFSSFMELCYLHENHYKPDLKIKNRLGLDGDEKYIILRFVSWDASHDVGQTGLDYETKKETVEILSKYAKVFISSEAELPDSLKEFQISIPPEEMHNALAFSSLFVGESGTMASECAIMGVPAIYINSLPLMGYLGEEQEGGLLFHFSEPKGFLDKAVEIMEMKDSKAHFALQKELLLEDKIDLTAFMVWFVENYPESYHEVSTNRQLKYRFM